MDTDTGNDIDTPLTIHVLNYLQNTGELVWHAGS